MDRLAGLEVFVEVVKNGSFTGAARSLGVSKSFVSKEIRRLEDRLGARLLNRTTRRVQPTEAGRAFYGRCTDVLDDLEEAMEAVVSLQTSPRGTLRLSVPMTFGTRYLAPAVAEFMSEWPGLDVDLSFSDRRVDILEEGFDLAIRVGELEDSSLIAKKLGPSKRYLAASPEYVKARGTPKHPRELKDHACLQFSYLTTGQTWRFQREKEDVSVRVEGPMTANNGEALVQAAIRGAGIVYAPDFVFGEALKDGRLVHFLEDWTDWRGGIWALYPHSRHLSAKVRVFVDFMAARFSPTPPWTVDA